MYEQINVNYEETLRFSMSPILSSCKIQNDLGNSNSIFAASSNGSVFHLKSTSPTKCMLVGSAKGYSEPIWSMDVQSGGLLVCSTPNRIRLIKT